MHEFTPWPKTARLFRDIVVTEKLDGTNAAIHISAGYEVAFPDAFELKPGEAIVDGRLWRLSAQSRKRIITPDNDNFGFAAWVYDNAAELVSLLGEGLHFGEWWGRGIQRGYGLNERRFSLFNTERHDGVGAFVGAVWVEPVITLYQGPNDTAVVKRIMAQLAQHGSVTVSGWPTPEGICVYHTATRSVSKVTLDNNDAGKWEG